ncbi:glycosyltransferase [Candidatus Microgenomates bacterium]|nr:glycosyltransferase [Candidatus Microgenomates bacterium]
MKIALVYDRVNKWGGAERFLLQLHEIFPDACLYTSVHNPKTASWAKVFPKIYTSFIQNLPFAKTHHDWYAIFMPFAFEQFNFDQYDLVISITSESAKGIITKPKTQHICICLTPTRYLWSGYEEYFRNSIIKFLTKPIVRYLRNWDKVAAQRPDKIIAISTEVKKRIEKYYGRKSEIIFPGYEEFKDKDKSKLNAKDYFLVVSRLVPYKKVELAIKTFNRLNLSLVIVGTGSQEWKLKLMAGKNIKFLGLVNDSDLVYLYKNCNALIFPQNEDFGLTVLECQHFGKPVIAYESGGAKDTIIDGKTGIFFEKQTEESLMDALKTFQNTKFDAKLISLKARKFSKGNFKEVLIKIINGGHI